MSTDDHRLENYGEKPKLSFRNYAWFVLIYNLIVILWGALVRATGSGAGCGAHWPLCNGQLLPLSISLSTTIEFIHRAMSGFTLIFVIVLAVWAFRAAARGSLLRKSAGLALIFTFTEAILGAGLVLFELVAKDTSLARAFAVMAHLGNTFLLLASLAITADWSTRGVPKQITLSGIEFWLTLAALIAVIILGATGAVTALGDTLFPAKSLAEGLQQDQAPTANFLIRIRVFHPLIAVTVGVYVGALAGWFRLTSKDLSIRQIASGLIGLFVLQLLLGGINIYLLAPIWMQMIHLFVADLVWICMVILAGLTVSRSTLTDGIRDHRIHHRIDQVTKEVA